MTRIAKLLAMSRRKAKSPDRSAATPPLLTNRNLAAILPISLHHARRIMEGICLAAKETPGWNLWPVPDLRLADLRDDKERHAYAAAIGFLASASSAKYLPHLPPVVNVSNQQPCKLPSVFSDDVAIGRLAADFLLGRGFRHFGYIGALYHRYSQQRLAGFRATVAAAGQRLGFVTEASNYAAALRDLEKPGAVFCDNDWTALKVLRTCLMMKLEVPWQVAVLGVDNDEIATYSTRFGLSSIEPDSIGIGRRAFAIIEDILAGRPAPAAPVLVAPLRVVERESTAAWAFKDQLVVRALKVMDLHARDGWKVKELSDHLKVAKRTLDRRFAAAIGKTVHEALLDRRLSHALQQIRSSSDTIETIAINSGFGDARTLYSALRRAGHPPPQQLRARSRETGLSA